MFCRSALRQLKLSPSLGRAMRSLPEKRGALSLMDPWEPTTRLLDEFERDLMPTTRNLLRGILYPHVSPSGSFDVPPPMDIKETPDGYEVRVDIPGVKKEDISVDIKDRLLAISANREGVNKSEGESFKVVERFQGHISRHVKLPENIDEESIDAKYQDGVLDLKIHKKEPEKNEHLAKKVEIK